MNILVMDVETDGLYGDGFTFAVAALKTTPKHQLVVVEARYCVSSKGVQKCQNNWIKTHVLPELGESYQRSPLDTTFQFTDNNTLLRTECYKFISPFILRGYHLMGDCIFPTITNFLNQMVQDSVIRANTLPHPVMDIATYRNIDEDRIEYCKEYKLFPYNMKISKYHPLTNAIASGLYYLHNKFQKEA
jgi:hypothetical protein